MTEYGFDPLAAVGCEDDGSGEAAELLEGAEEEMWEQLPRLLRAYRDSLGPGSKVAGMLSMAATDLERLRKFEWDAVDADFQRHLRESLT